MKSNVNKGKECEKIAVEYLIQQGFEILDVNWRFNHKEIDVIARNEKEIVFVEVKSRKSSYFGAPEESVNRKKTTKILIEAAEFLFRTK
ncbi:MAG: YraN family protein [Bacteroidales bacterium]|nr:YraN family protein [Bacteroidales bacterium]